MTEAICSRCGRFFETTKKYAKTYPNCTCDKCLLDKRYRDYCNEPIWKK